MPREKTNSVFEAKAESLHNLFMIEGGVAGFRIPDYQRTYDWSTANIRRFFEDALSGMMGLADDPESLTFIGTIIFVVEGRKKEPKFAGPSLSVIDGQQRLTTVALTACVLHEQINKAQRSVTDIPKQIDGWLKLECSHTKGRLLDLALGHIRVAGTEYFSFPRIVREQGDYRANRPEDSEYRSVIAEYLSDFSKHIGKTSDECFEYHPKSMKAEAQRFLENLEAITEYIEFIRGERDDSNTDIEANLPEAHLFQREGYRDLFYKMGAEREENKIVSAIGQEKDQNILGAIRLISFATYLMDCVIATGVKTGSEKYAFDIFDALNTTGEPLTAVETFRPRVIQFADGFKGYSGSPSEIEMKVVEQYLEKFKSSDERQREAKRLIVPFALYVTGKKVSLSLSEQRRYLRNRFDEIENGKSLNGRRRFVRLLAQVAEYKERFWSDGNIKTQLPSLPSDRQLILCCLKFLKDLDNSLTIPILCRYFTESQAQSNEQIFADAVKALTAFIVLRRGATGNTKGIDSDLRALMSSGARTLIDSEPLCAGLKTPNKFIETDSFKAYLRDWLGKPKIEVESKDAWVQKVKTQPLYQYSAPLCRFILLAASHNSRPQIDKPWRLKKEKASLELDYLNYERWISDELATVEHIAPDNAPKAGWDKSIYTQPHLKNCLGNLTLLPKEENSAVGNADWQKKKMFYEAFAAERREDVEKVITRAEKAGVSFGKKSTEMLRATRQLPIAKTIAASKQWTSATIEQRSQNLAELAWDEIAPWLFGS